MKSTTKGTSQQKSKQVSATQTAAWKNQREFLIGGLGALVCSTCDLSHQRNPNLGGITTEAQGANQGSERRQGKLTHPFCAAALFSIDP